MADELEKVKPIPVDLNDLSLVDEQVDVNAEADAFAGPPPPDDGDHRVKLSLGPRKVQTGKISKGADKGKPYYMVHVQGKVQPGDKFEGRVTFDTVSTMVMQGTGTSRMVGVLKALGETVQSRVGILEITKLLAARLDGEPEVIQQTQWSAYCADCKAEYDQTSGRRGKKNGIVLRGQSRFPQNGDGGHRHQVECPHCGSLLTAQAEVIAYKPVAA
jgi:hypothetical protein